MGIRFYCPHCEHKLNVKSFLAGKRGVCPRCGSGLDIPLESQIVKGAATPGSEPADGSPAGELADFAMPALPLPSRDIDLSSPANSGTPHMTPPGIPVTPTSASAGQGAAPPFPTISKAGVAPTVPTAAPVIPVASASPVRPSTPAAAATQVQSTPVDPIDESPEAVWYVRPPSGGQYGPARGDVMRKWIGEGRVSADSMVWREGWDDWRSGGTVFPYLRAAAVPPAPAPVSYAPSTPAPATSSRGYSARRRNSMALAVTTVIVLGLMSVALLVTLVLVINS